MTEILSDTFRQAVSYLPVSCLSEIFIFRQQQQGQMDYMTRTHADK
jgi:hypothetical protein